MMKKLLFAIFLFSICSATVAINLDFITHYETDDTGHMYREDALSTYYYVGEDIDYHLNTHMEVADPDQYLGGPSGSSWDDLYSTSSVCEGGFEYDTSVEAVANDFYGRIPAYSGSSHDPNDWTNCGPHPNCPGPNEYVDWDQPDYNAYKDANVQSGGPHLDSSGYTYRRITYQEVYDGYWFTNEVSRVATVGKGTASLKRGGTTIYNFGTLAGQHPSHSGTFSLHPSSFNVYTFTQRMDVTGMLMGVHNPNSGADNKENFMAYQSTGGSNQYSNSNIHDTGTLYVYPEENVGVIAPTILFIDLRDDGTFPMGSEQVTPGETFPVRMRMTVPQSYIGFWPLAFEFYNPDAFFRTGSTQTPIDWDVTTGIDQCMPGIYNMPFSSYTVDILGEIEIPASAAPGPHELGFDVSWQTCSGEEDCDGNGQDGGIPRVWIDINIPDDELPDLVCELEPLVYVGGIEPTTEGFAPGQGVEEWRLTITNDGIDDFIIPGVDSALCTMLAFNAYSSDGTGAYDPFYYEFLTSVPGSIDMGESVTYDIDGTAICVDETGQIEAEAWMNFLWWWYPDCIPFTPAESNFGNNYCEWEMPCREGLGDPEECTIIPSLVTNPDSEEVLTFDLYCDGLPCTGTVTWSTTPTGDTIGTMTANDSNGATVEIVTYAPDDVPEGSLLLEAAVATPNNMECEALIVLEQPPEPGACSIDPDQVDDPFSEEVIPFELLCDGDPCVGTVTWDTYESGDHIGDMFDPTPLGAKVEIVNYTEEDELSGYMLLEATIGLPDNMICNATITLNNDGPEDGGDCDIHCRITPHSDLGAPGSFHSFILEMYDDNDEDPEWGSWAGHWEIEQGDDYIDFTNPDLPHSDTFWLEITLISNMVIEGDGEEIRIRATVEDGDCSATCTARIELPPMDCFDYI
ncbi:MAG: hypothetical protein GY852_06725 [bacterium]|nr:hypothetical protein [bacterium]